MQWDLIVANYTNAKLTKAAVSQPSVVRSQSQQSLVASEDYYSLSSRSSNRSIVSGAVPRTYSRPDIDRFLPPAQVRIPTRGSPPRVSYEGIATPIEVRQVESPRINITPMRGVGKRRADESGAIEGSRREVPLQRKSVPSTVYEEAPRSTTGYTLAPAESSIMKDFARDPNPPTPEMTDTQHILFALNQITNDPDERGERVPLAGSFDDKSELGPFLLDKKEPLRSHPLPARDSISPPIPYRNPRRSMSEKDNSPPSPPDLLIPADLPITATHPGLTALPSILKRIRLGFFILVLALYTACLIFCAVWSRVNTGLIDYGSFGDGRYFLWQYLPTLLGMALLLWLFEIESAVHRVAPFIALSSKNPIFRSHGMFMKLSPSNFLLPSFSHYRAGQSVFTFFLIVSWLNLFTAPLLASSFNVYFRGGRWIWLATQGVLWTAIALYALLFIASVKLFLYLHQVETGLKIQTGLKWDARSLADLMTLVQASNTLDTYASYPYITGEEEVRDSIADRQDGLGYYQSLMNAEEVYHTIGAPDRPFKRVYGDFTQRTTPRYSTSYIDPESGRPYSNYSIGTHHTSDQILPQDMAASWQSYIPWFLRTSLVVLWLIAAIVLLLAFLIVSYLSYTRVSRGFLPELPVIQSDFGFSSANFLYSFIPSFIGLLCLLIWQPFDLAFRRLQPYASLSTRGGEIAERSLLLSYTADAPLSIAVKATVNGHLRVAYLSLVTLIAAALPILGGGIFWSQFSVAEQRVRIYADMPAYYALSVLFTIYCLSYAMVFPGKNRRLPNKGRCLADLIALVHQSRILDDSEFTEPPTKIALETRLLVARTGSNRALTHDPEKRPEGQDHAQISQEIPRDGRPTTGTTLSDIDSIREVDSVREHLQPQTAEEDTRYLDQYSDDVISPNANEQAKYGFGRYIGRDGREWLGIDKIGRPGRSGEMVVRE